jgi:hypothetical protein
LTEAAELGVQVHGSLHLVVAEEPFNVRPDGEGGGARLVDDVEDTLVQRRVQPIDDAVLGL